MNIHEYQAKELLAKFGVPVPVGYAAMSVEEAVAASVTTLLRVAACVRSTSALAVAKLLASAATILAMASVAEVVLDAP